MLSRLKISVYDIQIRPSLVLKAPLDHDLHILIRTVGLDHPWLPFLCCRTKAPLVSFTPPPLYRALIGPHDHTLFLCR
jgi:hypothetical protein